MFHKYGFDFRPRHERLLEKGDFKFVILDILKDKPYHGYEIIRTLEERFGGLYAPSPGAVYPTLQMLEDMGHATVTSQEGRKVYAITDEGRRLLVEREQDVERIKNRMTNWWSPWAGSELRQTMHRLRDIGQLLGSEGRRADDEKLRRVREIVFRAHEEIEATLRQ